MWHNVVALRVFPLKWSLIKYEKPTNLSVVKRISGFV